MKKTTTATSITAIALLVLSRNLFAMDVIYLANGDVISGGLVSYSKGICVFSTKYGATVTFDTSLISALETDDQYRITLASDEVITGRLISENKKPVVDSAYLGSVPLKINDVKSIVKIFTKRSLDSEKEKTAQKIGEDESKGPPLTFLAGSSVLLAPGQYEVSVGLSHRQSRDASGLPAVGYFQMSSYAARQFSLDTTVRGGFFKGAEAWVTLPYTYSHVEQVSSNAYVRSASAANVSDLSFGIQYQLLAENQNNPSVSANLAVNAPTGKMRYYSFGDDWKAPLNNGSGHWAISPGLAFARTTDPAILFGGVNYTYYFKRSIDGYNVAPGWGAGFYMGIGFALSDKFSLASRFSYNRKSRIKADGELIYGTDKDSMLLSFSGSYQISDKWIVTPMVTYGLNKDSGVSSISLMFKRAMN